MLCIRTNANVVRDLLLMLAKPWYSAKLRFLGIRGGVDDIVAGVNVTLLVALIRFSTNIVVRLETLLIFLLHSSVA